MITNRQDLRMGVAHKIVSDLEDVGKTRLQKLIYFLQEAKGVPLGYQFKMHHYGPYSEAVETDTSRLKLGGYVDVRPDIMGYGFHITLAQQNPESEWDQGIRAHEESLKEIIDKFGKYQTYELELAATIHFVKGLSSGSSKEKVIEITKSLKPKFVESYISQWYDDLQCLRFFE